MKGKKTMNLINGPKFRESRDRLDKALQECILKMQQQGNNEGTVTAKIKIELRNEQIELDEGFAIGVRPLFGFKISYGIKTEQKTEGMIAPEFLLIYDSEADGFKAIENGQTKLSMEEG